MFTMMIGDDQIFRYCIPMDNQRPELELKRFRDIYQYPDRNGESSWELVTGTVCNASLVMKFPSLRCSQNTTST